MIVLAAVLCTAAVPAFAVSGSSTLAKSGEQYIVTASSLNVRAGAGMGYSVLTRAPRGSSVTYISQSRGWWYVRLSNGTTGYVDKQYLTRTAVNNTGLYTVTVDKLLIRAEPKTTAKRLGNLKKGTTVSVSHLNGDWGYVSVDGKTGWVALKYLKKGGTATSAASVSTGNTYVVIADKLNVRSRASSSASRIDVISSGTSVRVTKKSGDWAYVSYMSGSKIKEGWVSVKYLG